MRRLSTITSLLVAALALSAGHSATASEGPGLITLERDVCREIVIEASRRRVWRVLTDFPAYPAWNPFITSIRGDLEVGAQLEVTIKPPGYPAMTFTPTVQSVDAGNGFSWLGHLAAPGVFDGYHSFELHRSRSGSTRFAQREHFSGSLVPATGPVINATEQGFEEMNQALERRVEDRNAP